MTLSVTFELDNSDLEHFRSLFQQARAKAEKRDPRDLLMKGRNQLEKDLASGPPSFVRKRLEGIRELIAMAQDDAWKLPPEESARIIEAVAYFLAAHSLIPEEVPILGLLDDAIAAELALGSLQHELEAYRDFCTYRAAEAQRRKNQGRPTDISKEDWLADRRSSLHSRMREHRLADSEGWHTITMFGL